MAGSFRRNDAGCNLDGRWYLRRVPLTRLTTYDQVEQNVVRPLGEKFSEVAARRPAAERGHAVA